MCKECGCDLFERLMSKAHQTTLAAEALKLAPGGAESLTKDSYV
jgi:hypothetical protein